MSAPAGDSLVRTHYSPERRAMIAAALERHDTEAARYRMRERLARLAIIACSVMTAFVLFYGMTR